MCFEGKTVNCFLQIDKAQLLHLNVGHLDKIYFQIVCEKLSLMALNIFFVYSGLFILLSKL